VRFSRTVPVNVTLLKLKIMLHKDDEDLELTACVFYLDMIGYDTIHVYCSFSCQQWFIIDCHLALCKTVSAA